MQYRLRDATWTVAFKSLITVHLMIREGSPDVTLAYLAKHRNMLAVSMFSDGQSWTIISTLASADPNLQPKPKAETSATMRTIFPNDRAPSGRPRLTGCEPKNPD